MTDELRMLINELRSAAFESGWWASNELATSSEINDSSNAMNLAEEALIKYLENNDSNHPN